MAAMVTPTSTIASHGSWWSLPPVTALETAAGRLGVELGAGVASLPPPEGLVVARDEPEPLSLDPEPVREEAPLAEVVATAPVAATAASLPRSAPLRARRLRRASGESPEEWPLPALLPEPEPGPLAGRGPEAVGICSTYWSMAEPVPGEEVLGGIGEAAEAAEGAAKAVTPAATASKVGSR
jgi:hypothetical protein